MPYIIHHQIKHLPWLSVFLSYFTIKSFKTQQKKDEINFIMLFVFQIKRSQNKAVATSFDLPQSLKGDHVHQVSLSGIH